MILKKDNFENVPLGIIQNYLGIYLTKEGKDYYSKIAKQKKKNPKRKLRLEKMETFHVPQLVELIW